MRKSKAAEPPASIDAEQATLGSMLISLSACATVFGLLAATDFYHVAHQTIFRRMQQISETGEPIDLLTVTDALKAADEIEPIGGIAYLNTLMNSVPTAVHAESYARKVLDCSSRRKLISAAQELDAQARDMEKPPQETAAEAAALLSDAVTQGGSSVAGVLDGEPIRAAAASAVAEDARGSVRSGLPTLDRMLRNMRPGNLILVAGRPGMGKSDLCLSIAWNAAKHVPVMVISLEMSSDECAHRLLANIANIPYAEFGPKLDTQDRAAIQAAAKRLLESKLRIADRQHLRAATIPALQAFVAGCLVKMGKPSLIVIDQLNVFLETQSVEHEVSAVSTVVYSIQNIAKANGIPILLQAQLNRLADRREDKRPNLGDLRSSGAIEAAADVVLFPFRPSYYQKDETTWPDKVELIVAKQRQGPTGTINVLADLPVTRWWEQDTEHEPPPHYATRTTEDLSWLD